MGGLPIPEEGEGGEVPDVVGLGRLLVIHPGGGLQEDLARNGQARQGWAGLHFSSFVRQYVSRCGDTHDKRSCMKLDNRVGQG